MDNIQSHTRSITQKQKPIYSRSINLKQKYGNNRL